MGNTLDVDTLSWVRFDASIGAGIDSFYEYLLKVGTEAALPKSQESILPQ